MKNYEFLEKIGRGTHGTTYLLKSNKDDRYVVCKSLPEKYTKHANRELNVLKKTNHNRIIKLIESIRVKNGTYLILEHANYGTLDSMIKYFKKNSIKASNKLIWSIAAQIIEGLKHLHLNNIIHRDIKPANILINRTAHNDNECLEFKICDFSLSVSETTVSDKCIAGTPYYMSPEIVSKKAYNNTVDVWALGIILYELYYGHKPFNGENRDDLYKSIKNDQPEFTKLSDPQLENLVKDCLNKTNRPTTRALLKNEKLKLTLASIGLMAQEIKIEKLEAKISYMEEKNKQMQNTIRK